MVVGFADVEVVAVPGFGTDALVEGFADDCGVAIGDTEGFTVDAVAGFDVAGVGDVVLLNVAFPDKDKGVNADFAALLGLGLAVDATAGFVAEVVFCFCVTGAVAAKTPGLKIPPLVSCTLKHITKNFEKPPLKFIFRFISTPHPNSKIIEI